MPSPMNLLNQALLDLSTSEWPSVRPSHTSMKQMPSGEVYIEGWPGGALIAVIEARELYMSETVARAVNTASTAAAERVYRYARKFEGREGYRPLEKLAEKVQMTVVRVACE